MLGLLDRANDRAVDESVRVAVLVVLPVAVIDGHGSLRTQQVPVCVGLQVTVDVTSVSVKDSCVHATLELFCHRHRTFVVAERSVQRTGRLVAPVDVQNDPVESVAASLVLEQQHRLPSEAPPPKRCGDLDR